MSAAMSMLTIYPAVASVTALLLVLVWAKIPTRRTARRK